MSTRKASPSPSPSPSQPTSSPKADAGAAPGMVPVVFSLTNQQQAFLQGLALSPAHALVRAAKVSPNIDAAFTDTVLAAISASAALGGPERADAIQASIALLRNLKSVGAVLGPLDRLASTNQVFTCAEINQHLTEVLDIARVLERRQPGLAAQLADALNWSRSNRGNHSRSKAVATPGAAPGTRTTRSTKASRKRKKTQAPAAALPVPTPGTPPPPAVYQGPAVPAQHPAAAPATDQGPATPRTG